MDLSRGPGRERARASVDGANGRVGCDFVFHMRSKFLLLIE